MSLRRARRPHPGRARRGLRTTALAVTAVAALTASQAPGLTGEAKDAHAAPSADEEHRPATDAPYALPAEPAPPGDGSYHTELPPLISQAGTAAPAVVRGLRSQSGIPATVLRAYRAAETSVGRTDPGCRLPWQLLAAIGKVESGHAGGGAVGPDGTTVRRITGPALDGRGFALIRDTEGGSHDGDPVYDRAVGPMQFLPSTWTRWGTDGNGDGRADPNNVFDAALAAGHYLCAGDRDLGRGADLDGAILSYNRSRPYLELVRYWLEFYSRGVHPVPDGTGVIPQSPGAGGETRAAEPADGADGGGAGGDGGGIVVGPDPAPPGSPEPSPSAPSPRPTPAPTPASPAPSAPTTPPASPTPSESSGEQPTDSPSPSPAPDPTAEPSPSPTEPDGCATESATPSPDPSASPGPSSCPTDVTG
ncbi:lytic transglycosylase domain-containing protein [Streptomyces sp.]|uniref:lytic transglycosylase domain-containing protein n=1 Tax=Streptomyces sp. TaxID=1931 RepID=UPI002D52EDB5|nr:lytic transglycosylase domain-containing protein [Streptomyces sp.]HZF91092.1 lytic transglycosylase domain-containing protein [Streptomyces sp.]